MKYSVLLILLFSAGCASSIIFSSKEEELYYEKCGGCHRVYDKNEFSKEHWLNEFNDMTKRAKLDSEQTEMLKKYLFDQNTLN